MNFEHQVEEAINKRLHIMLFHLYTMSTIHKPRDKKSIKGCRGLGDKGSDCSSVWGSLLGVMNIPELDSGHGRTINSVNVLKPIELYILKQ